MILHLPAPQRSRITFPRLCASAALTYFALPASAAAHAALIIWIIEKRGPLYRALSNIPTLLPRPVAAAFDATIETYAALLGATLFAFLLSWIGFILLLPIFQAQRRFGWDGWLPTTLIGATLGAFAVMPISLGPLDYAMEARAMFSRNPMPYFTAMGALHASVFWACLLAMTSKTPRSQSTHPLPLFLGSNIENPKTCNTSKHRNIEECNVNSH
jgi:hypothetical protein